MVRTIRDDNNAMTFPRREFTPIQATKMLPLVRGIAADVVRLGRAIRAQRDQLSGVDQLLETSDHPTYRDELSDIRGSLAADELRLRSCLDELAALGIEAHAQLDGSVDFPAVINRRQVRLCWHPGDESVHHWHEIGQLPAKRKPLSNTNTVSGR